MQKLQLITLSILLAADFAGALRKQPAAVKSEPVVKEVPRDRLSDSCKEPASPPRTADGEGPEEVLCCHSAKAKVAKLYKRQKDCNDAVPCSTSWKEILPAYLDYYKGLEDVLCKPRPTTTTTTTVTTTTTTTTEEKGEEEEDEKDEEEDEKEAVGKKPEDPLAWCKDACKKHVDDEEKCEKLCEELNGKVDEKMKAADCKVSASSSSGTVTKVTKTTVTTDENGKKTVTKDTTETKAEGEKEDAKKAEKPKEEAAAKEESAKKEASKEEAPKEEAPEEEAAADEEEPKEDEAAEGE